MSGLFDTGLLSPGNPLTNGLQAYYRFDEASGLRFDGLVPGTGPAAKFTRASSERLTLADHADFSGGDVALTIAGWARLDALTDNQTLFGKFLATGNQREYRINFRSSAGVWAWTVSADGTSTNVAGVNSTIPLAVGEWHFVLVEHDPTNNLITIQVDTEDRQTTAWSSGVFDGTGGLAIGADQEGGSNHLDGAVKSVGFWRRLLTDDEKSFLFNGSRGVRFSQLPTALLTNLSAWWDLDEESGNRSDSHSGGHTLTDTNTVTQTVGPQGNSLRDGNTVTSAAAKIGNGAVFTAANSEQLQAPDATELRCSDTDWEINLWVYLETTTGDMTLFAKDTGAAAGREYRLRYDNSDDRLHWEVFDGTNSIGSVLADTLGAPADDTWYFVRVYHKASDNTVGIGVNNGTIDTAATSGAASSGTTAAFRFGANGSGSPEYLNGRLDEFGKWNLILGAAEATARYAAGAGIAYPFA